MQIKTTVKEICKDNGLDLLIYCTLRTHDEQARCYRSSRTFASINRKAASFRAKGHHVLADILLGVGPVNGVLGKHITWAGPGESWHQYSSAFDAVPKKNGKLLWGKDNTEEWAIYHNAVLEAGMFLGPPRDYPHAQLHREGNPLDVLTVEEVVDAVSKYSKISL